MKTFNVFSAIVIVAAICVNPCESYGQVFHIVGKAVVKKGVKEAAEKSTGALAKETVLQVAERASKEAGEKMGKEAGTDAAESMAKHTVGTIISDGLKDFSGITAAKRLEEILRTRSMSVFAGRVGSVEAQNMAEYALEKTIREKAAKRVGPDAVEYAGEKFGLNAARTGVRNGARMVGKEALDALDDVPGLRKYVSELMENKSPYLNIDGLTVTKGKNGTHISFSNTNTSMTVNGNVITAKSGSIRHIVKGGKPQTKAGEGDLNVFLDNPLPDMTYKIDNYIQIRTDKFGRTISVETNSSELFRHMKDNGIEHGEIWKDNSVQMRRQHNSLYSETDYGHLVRRELGGINEKINALPMLHTKQGSGSRWFELENMEIGSCEMGRNVKSRMKIKYLPNGKYEIDVEKIIDGVSHHPVSYTDLL